MIEVEIDDPAWTGALPDAAAVARMAAEATLAAAGASPDRRDLVVLLTDDETMRALNTRFLGQDHATNVLSFPAPPTAGAHLGDVALAFAVCAAEANGQGKPLGRHLQHLVAHGVLHLVGYDHQTEAEAEVMEALERRILAGLGAPDPYADERGAGAGHG
jgi:probable rRNA maturation factor